MIAGERERALPAGSTFEFKADMRQKHPHMSGIRQKPLTTTHRSPIRIQPANSQRLVTTSVSKRQGQARRATRLGSFLVAKSGYVSFPGTGDFRHLFSG